MADETKTPQTTHRPDGAAAATPTGTPTGTPKPVPPPPPARALQNTAQELFTTSQELTAERGFEPSEADVERRLAVKRSGRAEWWAKNSAHWTKLGTIAIVVSIYAGEDLKAWFKAHADMGKGIVGLIGILFTGWLSYANRHLLLSLVPRKSHGDAGKDGSDSPPSAGGAA